MLTVADLVKLKARMDRVKAERENPNPNPETVDVLTKPCWHCGLPGIVTVPAAKWPALQDWSAGGLGLIQEIIPEVPMEQREQIITGVHPHCWIEMFGPFDTEEDEEF